MHISVVNDILRPFVVLCRHQFWHMIWVIFIIITLHHITLLCSLLKRVVRATSHFHWWKLCLYADVPHGGATVSPQTFKICRPLRTSGWSIDSKSNRRGYSTHEYDYSARKSNSAWELKKVLHVGAQRLNMQRSPTVNIKRWQAGVAIQRRKTKATYDSFTVYMAEVERPLRSPRKKSHSKRPCWSDSDPHAEVGGTASELSISREWRAEGDGGGNHCQNILNVCSFECSLVTDKLNWKSQKSHKRKLTGGLSCPCVCVCFVCFLVC